MNNPELELERLCGRLGYRFANESLLLEALSHRSYGSTNYERLEFLGDSLLGFIIADELYRRHPSEDEGSLSRLRANLVNGQTLADIARELKLGQCLRLGSGELKSGGFKRDSILSDVVESLIGAIYLDSNLESCQAFILRLFESRLEQQPAAMDLKDPKTRLQELLQGAGLDLPDYSLLKTTGKSHERQFTVRCSVDQMQLQTESVGASRRKAEQHAASMMLAESKIIDMGV